MVGAVSKGYIATMAGVVAVWLRLFTASSQKLNINIYKLKAAFPFEDIPHIRMWARYVWQYFVFLTVSGCVKQVVFWPNCS